MQGERESGREMEMKTEKKDVAPLTSCLWLLLWHQRPWGAARDGVHGNRAARHSCSNNRMIPGIFPHRWQIQEVSRENTTDATLKPQLFKEERASNHHLSLFSCSLFCAANTTTMKQLILSADEWYEMLSLTCLISERLFCFHRGIQNWNRELHYLILPAQFNLR